MHQVDRPLKAKVIVINIIIFIGLLAAVELGARLLKPSQTQPDLIRDASEEYRERDPVLGRFHKANVNTTITGSYESKTKYVVKYRFDEHARRSTPQEAPEKRGLHAIFLGCSNVFGPPVNDHETIPAWFAKINPSYRAYNYGVPGWGISHVLALLEKRQLQGQQVPESEGVGFYFYYDYHLSRSVPSRDTATWVPHSPYYELNDGTLTYKGLISEIRPWPYSFLRFFYSLDFVNALGAGLEPLKKYNMNYQIQLLKKIRSEYYRQFPEGDFQLVMDSDSFSPELGNALGREVIPYIIFEPPDVQTRVVQHDWHYNSLGNKEVAEQISGTYRNIRESQEK